MSVSQRNPLTLPRGPELVLASGSPTRIAMLQAAGLSPATVSPILDEAAIRAALVAEGASPRDIADHLAEAKALKIARKLLPAAPLVLGADQVLACDRETFGKPGSPEEARDQLRHLSGRTHELLSAAVIVEGGGAVWRHVGRARLTMRPFSDAFLDAYLAAEGPAVTGTAGGYRVEGPGVQLFSRIEGDWFTILGLPLLEIIDYLRLRGACPT